MLWDKETSLFYRRCLHGVWVEAQKDLKLMCLRGSGLAELIIGTVGGYYTFHSVELTFLIKLN